LTNTGSAFVGGVAGSSASVLVDAASWTNTGNLSIGTGTGPGIVTIKDGGLLTADEIIVGPNGSLIVDPSVVDADEITLMAGGVLTLDIAGEGSASVSQLDISGSGLFDGLIVYDFIDGFAPQAGETFDVINTSGSLNISGATIQIDGLAPGFNYSESYVNHELILTAINNGVSLPEPSTGCLLAGSLAALLLALGSRKAVVRP
jgi:T5SS/PEP-CTERM-associated repeat protein